MAQRRITLKQFDSQKELVLNLMRAEAMPFEDDSPSARRERKERCRFDLLEFARMYMPHYVPCEFSEYHETLADYCKLKNEPVFYSGPKGTGKSVLVTIIDCVKAAVFKQRMFTIIGSQTEDSAADRAAYIQFEFEYNLRLKQDFGNQRGTWLWEAKDFVLENGARIKARGINQQVAGLLHRNNRPDGWRGEDMEDEKSVRNPKRTKQLKDWVLEVALGGMGPDFSFVWGGNIISKRCALYELISEKDERNRKRYTGKIFKLVQDDGTSLVPDLWPVERIENMKRQLGPVSFNKVYQNDPVDPDAMFRPEWIRTISAKEISKRKNLLIKVFTDPIVEPTPQSDTSATIVAGIDLDQANEDSGSEIIVLDAVIRKLTTQRVVDWHYQFDEKWRPVEHWFEKVAFSAWLMKEFNRAAVGRHRLNVRPYDLPRLHKDVRVGTLTSPIETGRFLFAIHNGDVNKLVEQLLYYGNPGVPKDGPDALASLYEILNRRGSMIYVFGDDED